jgi:hypothetical protein
LPNPPQVAKLFNPASLAAISDSLADRPITIQTPWPTDGNGEAIAHSGSWWIIEPDRASIPQYANNVATPTLAQFLHEAGISVAHSLLYDVSQPCPLPSESLLETTAVLWVTHAPHDAAFRPSFEGWLTSLGPSIPIIQVDAGIPLPSNALAHVYTGTYRTPNLAALSKRLIPWMALPQETPWAGETFDWEADWENDGQLDDSDDGETDDDITSSN